MILFYNPRFHLYRFVSTGLTQDGKRQRHTGTKNDKKPNSSRKAKVSSATSGGRQLSLSSFFNKVNDEP